MPYCRNLLVKIFKKLKVAPPEELYEVKEFDKEALPSLRTSVFAAITPVFLMLIGAVIDMAIGAPPAKSDLATMGMNLTAFYHQSLLDAGYSSGVVGFWSAIITLFKFLSDANVALFMAVVVGIYTLGLKRGKKMPEIMKTLGKSVGAIAMIIMIIAAGGAFSQVLKDSKVNEYIGEIAVGFSFNPLILAFAVSAGIRLAVGSATVAAMTAAPIMVPISIQSGISPELMVLATGSGSLMFSHFNDIGFWMFKEYYNVSIKQTFAIWTVMECLVALVGLAAALIINVFI